MTWFVCMFRNSHTLFDWNGFFTASLTAGIAEQERSSGSEVKRKLHEISNGSRNFKIDHSQLASRGEIPTVEIPTHVQSKQLCLLG
jgi:hypothetical protein